MKINITIPVYNEEKILEKSVNKLVKYLHKTKFPYEYEIVIADNASIDNTQNVGKNLEKKYNNLKYHRINKKGRGRALKEVWSGSKCDVVSYMDVDLSTDLKSFRNLIDAIAVKKNDLAIGTRYGPTSKVVGRTLKREILSRGYNLLLRLVFRHHIKDAQCGFKAANRKSFLKVVKNIENNNWFFDTELILLCFRAGMKIAEIDVEWYDDPDTRVKVGSTIIEDLKGILRMKMKFIKEDLKKWRKKVKL